MAIFVASTKSISRGKGQSAVASASYRAGVALNDEKYGKKHDYSKRSGVMSADIIMPSHLANMKLEREQIWNMAEAVENRKDSRVAREWLVNLPYELDEESRKDIAHKFAQTIADRYNVIADCAIHKPTRREVQRGADPRNFHAHILFTTRQAQLNDKGQVVLKDKATMELSDTKRRSLGLERISTEIKEIRKIWEEIANEKLLENSLNIIDCRSYKEMGIDIVPQIKVGVDATQLQRRTGEKTDKSIINDAIKARNDFVWGAELAQNQRINDYAESLIYYEANKDELITEADSIARTASDNTKQADTNAERTDSRIERAKRQLAKSQRRIEYRERQVDTGQQQVKYSQRHAIGSQHRIENHQQRVEGYEQEAVQTESRVSAGEQRADTSQQGLAKSTERVEYSQQCTTNNTKRIEIRKRYATGNAKRVEYSQRCTANNTKRVERSQQRFERTSGFGDFIDTAVRAIAEAQRRIRKAISARNKRIEEQEKIRSIKRNARFIAHAVSKFDEFTMNNQDKHQGHYFDDQQLKEFDEFTDDLYRELRLGSDWRNQLNYKLPYAMNDEFILKHYSMLDMAQDPEKYREQRKKQEQQWANRTIAEQEADFSLARQSILEVAHKETAELMQYSKIDIDSDIGLQVVNLIMARKAIKGLREYLANESLSERESELASNQMGLTIEKSLNIAQEAFKSVYELENKNDKKLYAKSLENAVDAMLNDHRVIMSPKQLGSFRELQSELTERNRKMENSYSYGFRP